MLLLHLFISIVAWVALPACQSTDATTGADVLQSTRDRNSQQLTEVTTTPIAQAIFTYRVEATGKLQSLSNYTGVAEAGRMLTFFPIKTGSTVQQHCYSNMLQVGKVLNVYMLASFINSHNLELRT
jgi:hypothetical protein